MSKHTLQRNYFIGITFLIFILGFLFLIWQISRIHFSRKAEEKFILYSQNINISYKKNFEKYLSLLNSAKALIKTSDNLSRKNFEDFHSQLLKNNDPNIPGLDCIGYTEKITNRDTFISKIQNEVTIPAHKYAYFSIFPKSDREEYWVMDYLYPYDTNRQFFGYDILSDPEFNQYFSRAATTNEIVMTPPQYLINKKQILLINSIYDQKKPIRNKDERIKAVKGFVVLFINPDKLFSPYSFSLEEKIETTIKVFLGKIEKKEIVNKKPLYMEEVHTNDLFSPTDPSKKIDLLTYDQYGNQKITLLTEAKIGTHLGLLEGWVSNTVFIVIGFLIGLYFLIMIDLN